VVVDDSDEPHAVAAARNAPVQRCATGTGPDRLIVPGVAALAAVFAFCGPPTHAQVVSFTVTGDAIAAPLASVPGDVARGRALLVAREPANCVLCHAIPDAAIRQSGDVGPSLAGVGARLSDGQLRLRVVDYVRVNPAAAMPSYYRVAGLTRVAAASRDRPLLAAGDVEDLVAYLATLR